MDSETRNYEFSYLLPPSLSETEASSLAAKLSADIVESGGTVTRSEPPQKRKLAYAIKKETTAYFGWVAFCFIPEALGELKKRIAGRHLLRSLFVLQDTAALAPVTHRAIPRTMRREEIRIPRAAEKTDEKLDLEALDKKLEEILGK